MQELTNQASSKLLLVDDDVSLTSLLKDYLELQGYQVIAANNGRQALEILEKYIPDRIKGLNLGANTYMNKPFEPEELLAQVKSTLSQSSRIQQHVETITPVATPIQVYPHVTVTPTELKILLQVAQGFGNKKIAQNMEISQRTVESHISNVLSKTGLSNRTELARWVMESRIE
jgi:DNA-binding NarL/FixJ family response regulator